MKLTRLLLIAVLYCSYTVAQVGIGTTMPDASSILDIESTTAGVLIPRVTLVERNLIQDPMTAVPATGLLVYQIDNTPGFYYYNGAAWQILGGAAGDITDVTAGAGLTGGGTTGAVTLSAAADNGLNVNAGADRIRLGGTILENTTITNGAFDMVYDLTGIGDFHIQDNSINHFSVTDDGNVSFGGNVNWADENTGGTLLAQLIDDGNDGRFTIRENGIISVDLDANTQFVFNEQGLDRNFRIESNTNADMVFVDAGLNRVGIGTNAPTTTLDVDGFLRVRGVAATNPGDVLMSQDNLGTAAWSNSGFGMVPIGSIVAWHGNIGGGLPALPQGWVECTGGTVLDVDSPINGRPIPNLNNNTTSSSGDVSRGRFLRGSTTSGQFQADISNNMRSIEADDTDSGGTIVNIINDDGNWSPYVRMHGSSGGFSGGNHRMRVRHDGVETRVINMSVRWIMRIK